MSHWEITRLVCYTIAAPLLLYMALRMARSRQLAYALFFFSISMLFTWYMVEVTLLSSGLDTRQYRIIATPLVVMATMASAWMVFDMRRYHWRMRH